MIKVVLYGAYCDLNTYVQKERSHRFAGAKVKEKETNRNINEVKGREGYDYNFIYFKWFRKNKKKDPDNIAFSKKFILDTFVKGGFLTGDGWKQIGGFCDDFFVDEIERTEVFLFETKKEMLEFIAKE